MDEDPEDTLREDREGELSEEHEDSGDLEGTEDRNPKGEDPYLVGPLDLGLLPDLFSILAFAYQEHAQFLCGSEERNVQEPLASRDETFGCMVAADQGDGCLTVS